MRVCLAKTIILIQSHVKMITAVWTQCCHGDATSHAELSDDPTRISNAAVFFLLYHGDLMLMRAVYVDQ